LAKYKIISFGLGQIGRSIAKLVLSRPEEFELIGAIDTDPELVGKDISELLFLPRRTGIRVRPVGEDLVASADAILDATSSFLSDSIDHLLNFCEEGVDVVSTCEELSYPWLSHKEEAERLDAASRKNGVTLLGAGVNPGFVMDALAITLSGACAKVSKVNATRVLDASKRRLSFQKKVGIGMTPDEFETQLKSGTFGHVGLSESIAMTCAAMGVGVDKVEQRVEPKIAEGPLNTEHFGRLSKGSVIGLIQDAKGYANGKEVANYHIQMYVDAEDPRDEIELLGEPPIKLMIPGGTPGDPATAAIIVNSVPRVVEAQPGLMTLKDLRPAASLMAP
jgi:2,4-diaminopentanoate dehydrogenase